jgi:ribulose-5-phosphate 4-epimerase/fuculose-1-phosphate aldolase
MNSDLEDVKRDVAAANRVLANLGLATGLTAALGHASMRVPSEPDHFFVKGREYEFDALAIMEPDDMVTRRSRPLCTSIRATLSS